MTRLRCFLYHLPLSLLLILCIRLVLLIYVDIAAFALIDSRAKRLVLRCRGSSQRLLCRVRQKEWLQ